MFVFGISIVPATSNPLYLYVFPFADSEDSIPSNGFSASELSSLSFPVTSSSNC